MAECKKRNQSNAGKRPVRPDSAFSVLYGLSDWPVLTLIPWLAESCLTLPVHFNPVRANS